MASSSVTPHSDAWRERYIKSRYLEFLSGEDLQRRYVDLLDNVLAFDSDGKPQLGGIARTMDGHGVSLMSCSKPICEASVPHGKGPSKKQYWIGHMPTLSEQLMPGRIAAFQTAPSSSMAVAITCQISLSADACD